VLTDTKIRNAKSKAKGYRLADYGGLHLFVTAGGVKVWRWRFDLAGREQTLSLGLYPKVSLANARSQRDDARKRLVAGQDPRTAPPAPALTETLSDVAKRWHSTNAPRWKPHHAADVLAGLQSEIMDRIGKTPIKDVTAMMVLSELRRLEARGAIDTAHRIRGRLSAIFAFSIGEGACETNPAEAIRAAMAPLPKLGHRPAVESLEAARDVLMKAESVPAFPATRLAMRFLALTAMRPGEVGGALWTEIEGDTWRIPAERMKSQRAHDVPLSRQALETLAAARVLSGRMAVIFPSAISSQKGLAQNTLSSHLLDAGLTGIHVPHGWRATFSTIMNTRYPADRLVIDLMLARAPGSAKGSTEAVYNRADHMDRRRELAQLWADLLMDGLPPAKDLLELRRRS
jgi:integrase